MSLVRKLAVNQRPRGPTRVAAHDEIQRIGLQTSCTRFVDPRADGADVRPAERLFLPHVLEALEHVVLADERLVLRHAHEPELHQETPHEVRALAVDRDALLLRVHDLTEAQDELLDGVSRQLLRKLGVEPIPRTK